MIPDTQPFVLLDDARATGAGMARLYRAPVGIVTASRIDQVVPALERLARAQADGLHAAGYLGYEAGAALEARVPAPDDGDTPLLWFGLFEGFASIAAGDVAALLPDPAGAWAGTPEPEISAADYAARFARVRDYIAAGDIYQANLSFRARIPVAGHPLALYARLRAAAAAGWGGAIFTGERWLLSASPELFFTLEDGALTTRPMKGTAARRGDPAEDRAAAAALAADPKERAENLMIVDLLRNDLSRVAEAGSVHVSDLFAVETYPTIHTMTSTVTARLVPERSAINVLGALFPCGSVTGAPKIRAMEIIAEVEPSRRGPYTGSIGWLDPAGNAAFNVVIRTLTMKRGAVEADIGLGSAVVADSTASGEWAECLAKGRFVTAGARPFDLIETMAFDPTDGLLLLERHLERMKASADALGFRFDRHDVRNELQAATFRLRAAARVRLLLARSGAVAIEIRPAPAAMEGPVAVSLTTLPVDPADFRLHHKTTDRDFYRDALASAGTFEVVFADREGMLTEGSFTNVFVQRDGALLTPPLSRGLLPGILRAQLLDERRAVEADLTADDLAGGFLIGNALRGLMAARLTH
jgi:para-aminobenzoate synthetase/4-amino-4-deoxychorismate lyase